jgi:tripartite-type tricarboxylate transporter receptor subunit TctC
MPGAQAPPRADPQRSFTHIGLVAALPFALVGNAQAAPPSFAALLETLRKRPDALNYGSAGIASPHHMAMELLLDRVDGRATHVPFKGVGPAIPELLAGRIELMFSTFGAVEQHVRSGALRVYGVSGTWRLERHPTVPTIAEQSVAGYEAAAWQGVIAPAGLGESVRSRLHASLQRVLAQEATIRRFQDMGIEPLSGSSAQFEEYARAQAQVWSDLVRRKGIRAQ